MATRDERPHPAFKEPLGEHDVVVLGAGFSKAFHEAFPLVGELAVELGRRLDPEKEGVATRHLVAELTRQATKPGSSPTVDLETWLSRLAEDQPHLEAAENFARQALFARAATEIRAILLEAENEAFAAPLPSWASALVQLFHWLRPTVLTLNYDQVVEQLAGTQLFGKWRGQNFAGPPGLVPDELFRGLPPCIPPSIPQTEVDNINAYLKLGRTQSPSIPQNISPGIPISTFRLLKLHGSIGWFATPRDPTGLTLAHWSDRVASNQMRPTDPNEEELADERRRRDLPGREPFLVPPAAHKSPYLTNPIVREIWWQARKALEQARRVVLVGYSLPVTDMTVAGLLADTLAGTTSEILVVDRSPKPVVNRLRRLGIGRRRIKRIGHRKRGNNAVAQWVTMEIDAATRAAAHTVRSALAACPTDVDIKVAFWDPEGYPDTGFFQRPLEVDSDRGHDLILRPRPRESPDWPQFAMPKDAQRILINVNSTCRPVVHMQPPRGNYHRGSGSS